MLRTAFGALDALLGGSAARSNLARDAMGRISRASAKVPTVPWQQRALMSQLRASRPTTTRAKLGQFKSPFLRPRRPIHSSRPRRSDKATKNGKAAAEESLSLSGRLKKLSREYGWTAAGVYLTLSVLDFPFCFLLVQTVGTEKIAHLEEIVVVNAQKVIPESVQLRWREYRQTMNKKKQEETGEAEVGDHGVAAAEERNNEGASLATQLALAYAIHKSFIFIRVPLTAAITPKIVHVLRSWGWQIGKRKAKRQI